MESHERIILSLDGFKDLNQAIDALRNLGPAASGSIVKLKALLDIYGHIAVTIVRNLGYRAFVDLKIHDTPDAAAERVTVWRDAGADFLTIHACGHDEMMKVCVEAAGEKMKILAVTVLTSFDHTSSMHVFGKSPRNAVSELAFSASMAGVHGVVASPEEIGMLRLQSSELNNSPPLIVTPGVRPKWAAKNDQERTATPAEAIRAGADYLVIGRPIFKPPPEIGTPAVAFARIIEEIKSVDK